MEIYQTELGADDPNVSKTMNNLVNSLSLSSSLSSLSLPPSLLSTLSLPPSLLSTLSLSPSLSPLYPLSPSLPLSSLPSLSLPPSLLSTLSLPPSLSPLLYMQCTQVYSLQAQCYLKQGKLQAAESIFKKVRQCVVDGVTGFIPAPSPSPST